MRILYTLIIFSTILGWKQTQKGECQNQDKKERWFFWSVDWHPTANKLAIAVQDGKSKLAILSLDNDQKIELDSITNDGARAIGWNNAGNLLATGDNEGFLTFFDENGTFLKKIDTEQKGLMGLDWHPEKNLIVTVGEKISLYDYETGSMKHVEDRKEDILMLSVSWNKNGSTIIATDDPGKIIFWDRNLKRLNELNY